MKTEIENKQVELPSFNYIAKFLQTEINNEVLERDQILVVYTAIELIVKRKDIFYETTTKETEQEECPPM